MTIGVVGAGTMGSGIAMVASLAGHRVFLYDAAPGFAKKKWVDLVQSLDKQVAKGKLTKEEASAAMNRIEVAQELADLAPCLLVIEAIIEDLEVKKDLFRKLEQVVGSNAWLASNTSSFSITSLAAALSQPSRFIGLHFFNPAQVMKLVEVIPAVQTDPNLGGQLIDLMKKWGKLPVLAKDTPGFIVNRVARTFYSEALRILDEGIASKEEIDYAMRDLAGFPMGPFQLMDFIGHDVNYVVTESVFKSTYFDARYTPSITQKRLLEAGYLGKKTGRGFYSYTEDGKPKIATSFSMDPILGERIWKRILAMLINDAADAVYYGIASAADVDLAMTKGVNYPKGLFAWGQEWGWENVAQQLDALYHFYHEPRYRCSPWVRQQTGQSLP